MEYVTNNSNVAVFITALNEEEGIGPTIEEMRRSLNDPFFLVVDGKSVDKTLEIAVHAGAKVVVQDGKGKGQAICQGLENLPPNTKYVVFTDADFTYPAKHVPKMIEILDENPGVGMVVGNRFNRDITFKEASNDIFLFGNRLLAFAQHLVNGIKLQDPLTGLRVVRSELLKGWIPKSKGFDIEAEMNYLVERKKYQIVEIPIGYRPRLGEKKLKLRHGLIILNRILIESMA